MDELYAYSTRELVEELSGRDGVKVTTVKPQQNTQIDGDGPAIVLVVTD